MHLKFNCLFVVLLLLFVESSAVVTYNHEREYSIKLANCRKHCLINKVPDEICAEQCTLQRACLLDACQYFCPREDDDTFCNVTCQSFMETLSCEAQCSNPPTVTVQAEVEIPSINVSVTLPSGALSHVTFLEQIEAGNRSLTHDSSPLLNSTFSGLYPWREYGVEVVILSRGDQCCVYRHNDWWGKKVNYVLTEERSKSISFLSYPLPRDWVVETENGTHLNSFFLFPNGFIQYSKSTNTYEILDNETAKSDWSSIKVQSADFMTTGYKDCSTLRNSTQKRCAMRYGMGYMVQIKDPGDQEIKNIYGKDYKEYEIKNRPRLTCRNYPNMRINKTVTALNITCAKTQKNTSNVIEVGYSDDGARMRYCNTSTEENGPLNTKCNDGAVKHDQEKKILIFKSNYTKDYLLYFSYDKVNVSKCKYEYPCDGFYQRFDLRSIEQCKEEEEKKNSTDLTIVLIAGGTVLVALLLISLTTTLVMWRRRRSAPHLEKPPVYIPNEEDALLGGELPRDAISKESYIDKGNFGRIFGGKLKVKQRAQAELTKQYDVALKILQTDKDCGEHDVKEAKKAMKAEINIMRYIQDGRAVHDHVLRMYGYVVDAPPYILVLELGISNLSSLLRTFRQWINDETVLTSGSDLDQLLAGSTEQDPTPMTPCNSMADYSGGPANAAVLRTRKMLTRHASGYNDSVHGRMMRTSPCLERFKDINLTTSHLLNFCWQVSKGMDFLHSIDLIHRDLACDNVLLKEGSEPDSLICKICDFGQSRCLYNGQYISSSDNIAERQRMLRLRWTAPEMKQNAKKSSKFCDVWSYGVFAWETFTLGGKPYPNWPDDSVISNLLDGMRMEKPACCGDAFWKVVQNCWNICPEERGDFISIKLALEEIMNDEKDKEMGIQKSDYAKCEIPDDPIPIDEDLEDEDNDFTALDIMEIDDQGEPLSLDLDAIQVRESAAGKEDNIITILSSTDVCYENKVTDESDHMSINIMM